MNPDQPCLVARKPCGCRVEWIPDYRGERLGAVR